MRARPRRLSAVMGLPVGGGLLILGLAVGSAVIFGAKALLQQAFEEQAQALARQLATVALDAVLISDYGTLERYVRDLALQPEVRYLRVQRADGEVLGEGGESPAASDLAGTVRARWPIVLGANRLGEVLVDYDATPVRRAIWHIALIWLSGLAVAVVALYLWLRQTLERSLVRPMARLAAALAAPEPHALEGLAGLPEELARVGQAFADLCERLRRSGAEREEAEQIARGATERLCQEQRLASVGQMAAGLAHGLNTPLGNILGYAQQARRGTQDPGLRERLLVIEEQARVCAAIVRNLLDAVRPPEPRPSPLDLMDRVGAIVRLMAPILRARGLTHVALVGPAQAWAYADPGGVEQVLFNLMTNASEAGAETLRLAVTEDTEKVFLTLEDDGRGIPQAVRARLFEPFVTDKPAGRGTGLGLHLCRSLLAAVGGEIELEHTGPGGSRFRVAWRAARVG